MAMLEITVQRKYGDSYPVVAEYSESSQLAQRGEGTLVLDDALVTALLEQQFIEPRGYGTSLGQALFQPTILKVFNKALDRSANPVRVLLVVEDLHLQHLHWEWLCAPLQASNGWTLLSLDQRTPFSRYLPSLTDRRFPPIGSRDFRALIVVADPPAANVYQLETIDAEAMVVSVQQALGKIPSTVLANVKGAAGPPTLDALAAALTAQPYTLLHVVAHGEYERKSGESTLFLLNAAREVDRVSATTLLQRLGTQGRLPQLTFLATCNSATPAAEAAGGGLAQRLVRELGMPAVVAMTQCVSIATTQALATQFYTRLREHGQPDLALTEATAGLASAVDITVPALFGRLGQRSLFSDNLNRALTDLTDLEIAHGLTQIEQLLPVRSPVLQPIFAQLAIKVRNTLGVITGGLSASVRNERKQALDALDQLCQEVCDLSFLAVALGSPFPAYDNRCPFLGLFAFKLDDHKYFFGRETLVQELRRKLAEMPFLAVMGPSGSGKSSLVLAGLLPAVQDAHPDWVLRYLTPTDDPLLALAMVLEVDTYLPSTDAPYVLVVDQFEELFTLCSNVSKRQQFVDQLLALMPTSTGMATVQAATKSVLSMPPPKPQAIVLTMRADFWGDCAAYTPLAVLMEQHQKLIAPMTPLELRSATEQQAAVVGLRFEADLAQMILEEVQEEPGAMPLLQHALLKLWQHRHGRWLRSQEYHQSGRVLEAIAHTADTIYLALNAHERRLMRTILQRLAQVDAESVAAEARRDTRRRVHFDELVPLDQDPTVVRRLVNDLASARLVVTDGAEYVEIAHEALIQHWPRLREWLDEDRAVLRLRQRIYDDAQAWRAHEPQGAEKLLPRWNAQLAEGLQAAQNPHYAFNQIELDYLQATLALHECEEKEKEAQRQRELEQALAQAKQQSQIAAQQAQIADEQASSNRKLGWWARIASGIGLVALIFAVAAGWFADKAVTNAKESEANAATAEANGNLAATSEVKAEQERNVAQLERATAQAASTSAVEQQEIAEAARVVAEQQSYLAQSGELVTLSQIVLDRREDPSGTLPLLLGREAVMTAQRVFSDGTSMSISALESALAAAPLWKMTLPHSQHIGVVHHVAFSPTEDHLASAGADGTVRIWNVQTGEQTHVLVGHSDEVRSVAWNTVGDRIVTASTDGTVRVWDALSGGTALLTLIHESNVLYAAWSYNGRYLLTTAEDSKIRIWDLETNKVLRELNGHSALVYAAAWSPDDKRIVSASWDLTARIWSVDDGSYISLTGHTAAVFTAAFSNDGRYVVTTSSDHTAKIWDATSGKEITTLVGHRGNVYAAAFSPDGNRVITASDDKTLGIWNWAENSPPHLQQLTGYETAVVSADWSPSGRYVVGSELKGAIRIWNVETGQQSLFVQGHHTWVMSAKWSHDGSKILSTSADHTARIWDAETGEQLRVLQGHSREVWGGAWGPNDEEIVTVGDDGTAVIWNSQTGIAERQLYTQSAWIRVIQYSPDDTMFAIIEKDGKIRIWDRAMDDEITQLDSEQSWPTALDWSPDSQSLVASFGCDPTQSLCANQVAKIIPLDGVTEPATLTGHEGAVLAVAWSPDGEQILTGGADGTVRLWDVKSRQLITALAGHLGGVRAVAWHPNRPLFATAGADNSIRIWDLATGTPQRTLLGHTAAINSIAWHPSDPYLLTASEDRTVRIWYAQEPLRIGPLTGEAEGIQFADFSPDSSKLVLAGTDRVAYVWDLQQQSILWELDDHKRAVLAAEFDPSGSRIVTASGEQWAYVWDLNQPKASFFRLIGHNRGINDATWSHDGGHIATASEDTTARIWDAQSGQEVQVLRGHSFAVQQVTFSQDNLRVATASADRTVRIWDTATGTQLQQFEGHTDGVMTVAFSYEGTWIATAGRDSVIRIWDANMGTYLFPLEGHTDDIVSLVWSPDDQYLMSASMDKTAWIWNVTSHEEVRLLQDHTSTVTSASWNSDGQWIITSSLDGTARLWPASVQQLLASATSRMQRNPSDFTPEERERFGISH